MKNTSSAREDTNLLSEVSTKRDHKSTNVSFNGNEFDSGSFQSNASIKGIDSPKPSEVKVPSSPAKNDASAIPLPPLTGMDNLSTKDKDKSPPLPISPQENQGNSTGSIKVSSSGTEPQISLQNELNQEKALTLGYDVSDYLCHSI